MTGRENEHEVKLPSLGWLAERAEIVEEFLHYARSQGAKGGVAMMRFIRAGMKRKERAEVVRNERRMRFRASVLCTTAGWLHGTLWRGSDNYDRGARDGIDYCCKVMRGERATLQLTKTASSGGSIKVSHDPKQHEPPDAMLTRKWYRKRERGLEELP